MNSAGAYPGAETAPGSNTDTPFGACIPVQTGTPFFGSVSSRMLFSDLLTTKDSTCPNLALQHL